MEKGINVPAEISVIGFGDIELSRHVTPRLTSVKIFESEVAKIAVKKLVEEISAENTEPCNVAVPVELVVRQSCGPVAQKKLCISCYRANFCGEGGEI